MNTTPLKKYPTLPRFVAQPLGIIPNFVHNKSLVTLLNKLFKEDLTQGELDFLQNKVVQITVDDASLVYCFTILNNKFVSVAANTNADLLLNGTVYNYLLLASRKEDTDTLFFNRQLKMQGDTELGLYVKNFLDGLDMSSHNMSSYLATVLEKSLPIYARLFSVTPS